MRHVISDVVPPSIPGSPQWHGNALKDLLTKASTYGMPHLFLTLTADEVSELRWEEIKSLEEHLQRFNAGFSWKVCAPHHLYTAGTPHGKTQTSKHPILQQHTTSTRHIHLHTHSTASVERQ